MSRSDLIDLTGQKFGRLTVVGFYRGGRKSFWYCECSCGKIKIIRGDGLRGGHTKSCGCLAVEASIANATKWGEKNKTHGMTKTPEWRSWQSMKTRCYNKNHVHWKHYGGRGIKICRSWKNSFEEFYKDMGARPSLKHSIDRINFNGNYEPKNCKWSTASEQARNRRLTSTHSTGVKYVTICRGKYRAAPYSNGKQKTLGYFKTIKQAQKAIEEYLCQKN